MGLGLLHRPFAVALAAGLLVVGGLADAASAGPSAPTPALVRLPMAKLVRGAALTSSSATGGARLRRQPTAQASRPPASDWQVKYTGFTPQAQAAFKAAVDTWAGLISSRQPINVCATFKDLGGEGVLGQAGPTDFVLMRRDGNGGDARTYYPLALANALTRTDLSPVTDATDPCSGSDITAEFSSTEPCIYYGTDGAPPSTCTEKGRSGGYIDFETIVLHELAHGLGFLGSASVVGALGYFGDGTQPDPTVYDRFVVQSAGTVQGKHLVTYPNGSTALAGALSSGALYWDGPSGKAADRGRPVRLYAPSTFSDASSFSHLSDSDFPAGDPDALMTPFIADGEVIHDPGSVALGMFADMGWGVAVQPPGVRYTPLAPVRILDTRDGTGGLVGRLGSGKAFDLTVVGSASGVPVDATAVVLNVTGIGPASPTNLRLYPTPRSGTAQPLVSNLNLSTGATRANLATVPVGQGGRVRILNSGGAPHVLVDVEGWYGPSGGSALEPTTPVRLLDTRDGTGGVAASPLGPGQTLDLTVTGGARSVPDTATAVILTVTAVNATDTTDVRVYPTPSDPAAAPPQISNINLGAGQTVPNLVVAKVGSGGRLRLRNSAGSVDLIADLAGWYDDDPNGALFHVLAPQRVLDTRTTVSPRLRTGEERDLPLAGVAGVPTTGAAAVTVNVTGVDASQTTDIAVYPTPNDGSFPLASNLNLQLHQTAADLAIVATGLGEQIRLRNSTGEVALVVDIVGWFGL